MATPAQIKKLHALKGALNLDDDTYRATLAEFGVKSSKDRAFTIEKADELIGRWQETAIALGRWEKRKPASKAGARKLADDAQSKKIRALWLELHQVGKVREPSEAALLSYIKRMTGRDRLEWISGAQASRVIEALKKWLGR
jgi:phage gp16-like protein